MVDINNLHLVKKELINLNDLIENYKEAFNAYYGDLTDDEHRRREHAHPDEKIKDIMENLYPVHAWVSQAEGRFADQLRDIEWSLRAPASMRAVRLFLRAQAVTSFVMRAASTLKITNGEQRALRKLSPSWNLSLLKRWFAPSNMVDTSKTGQRMRKLQGNI